MARLILDLGAGAQTAAARAAAMEVAGVQDAVEATAAGAVIVTVPESDLTSATRQELANLPGVDGVFEDIQALPQVANPDEVEDFLSRVREARGGADAPPLVEVDPTRPGDEDGDGNLRPDGGRRQRQQGGATTLPLDETDPVPTATGPIQSATDSLAFTGAADLHAQGVRGESIIAVVLDTGSCGESIRDDRQLDGLDLTDADDPWQPFADHGGMATGIMAGDETTPGIETGFLPESQVFPIKSTLAASELIQAQDAIIRLAEDNPDKTVVSNNSWGFPQCTGLCGHPVTSAVESAASHAGVAQVFAAGNGASGITGCGLNCDGSTPGIAGPNSLSNVITVAASGRNGQPGVLQPYSSRGGPGSVACGSQKPDVAAPIFGTVPYGCGERQIGNGGGTSGACPMVAGSVGLLADTRGSISTASATAGLMRAADQFRSGDWNGCSGAGNVQVAAAAEAGVPTLTSGAGRTATVAAAGLALAFVGAALRERFSG